MGALIAVISRYIYHADSRRPCANRGGLILGRLSQSTLLV